MKFFPAIAWCHFWIALHYLNIRRRCDLVEYYRWWFLYFDTFWGNLIDFNQELNQQSNRCKDQQASPGLLLYDPQRKRRFSPLCLLGSASDAHIYFECEDADYLYVLRGGLRYPGCLGFCFASYRTPESHSPDRPHRSLKYITSAVCRLKSAVSFFEWQDTVWLPFCQQTTYRSDKDMESRVIYNFMYNYI